MKGVHGAYAERAWFRRVRGPLKGQPARHLPSLRRSEGLWRVEERAVPAYSAILTLRDVPGRRIGPGFRCDQSSNDSPRVIRENGAPVPGPMPGFSDNRTPRKSLPIWLSSAS